MKSTRPTAPEIMFRNNWDYAVKKTIKIQIWSVSFICLLSFLGTMMILANTRLQFMPELAPDTIVKGLEPGTKVTLNILPSDIYTEEKDKEYGGVLFVDANGTVMLPSFRRDFKFYSITIENEKTPVTLNVTYNNDTGRLNIQGNGFQQFSDVFISKDNEERQTKTDWAGLFSDSTLLTPKDFDLSNNVKLAFQGFTFDPEMLGSNPARVEVVLGVGGTSNPNHPANEVNDYGNDRIHEESCGFPTSSTDGDDRFYVSTCDRARMQAHMDTGVCSGGPPCTSSRNTITQNFVHPMMAMAEQLSAVMMQQMGILGSLIDAKEQNEVIRDFRHMVAEAHKDYHPSEQMCRFGSYVRGISSAEERSKSQKKTIHKMLSYYYNSPEHTTSSEGYGLDIKARLSQFKTTYCNPNDNSAALWQLCRSETLTLPPPSTNADPYARRRYNRDIDYFTTLDRPLTLDVDFTNNTTANDTANPLLEPEEDLLALAKHLYWPKTYNLAPSDLYNATAGAFPDNYDLILAARNLNTKISLAHNSFATIAGMKSKSDNPLGIASGGAHLKALLREFGLSDTDIEILVGTDPSYYAQMEILAKKIYQNPTFYTNLYDKPVNVDRINASMEAFQNMHMRDRYESQLRQEMLISQLVEQAISERVREVNAMVGRSSATSPKTQAGTGY